MTISVWKGNQLPVLAATITSNGAAFDLTGGTVTFSMRPTDSSFAKISGGSATITDAANGGVSYSWGTSDVDAVGDYYGWWTYEYSGKQQDTSEFAITIQEHSPGPIAVPIPVAEDGTTSIFKAGAYTAAIGNPLIYSLAPQDAPDLTQASAVTYRVEGAFGTSGTAIDPSTVSVDLSSIQTNLAAGTYRFQIEAAFTGGTAIVFRSNMTVLEQITSP
jgi:BppU N-terminal domain